MNNIFIFGDSYSTFLGYIPEHYAAYYWQDPSPCHGLNRVEQTWWHQLISETGTNLVMNDSWSGSTVGFTGYEGENTDINSFIARLEKYIAADYFNDKDIDTLFIFGATNDDWCGAEVGELQYEGWVKEDLYRVLPAVCYMINRAKQALRQSKIYWIINTELKDSIAEGIKAACRYYDIEYIALEHIEKIDGHPTPKGMTEIKDRVMKHLFS